MTKETKPKRKRKSTYKSRTTRLALALEPLRVIQSKIINMIQDAEDKLPRDEDDQFEEYSEEYKKLISMIDDEINTMDISEIESLKSEIETWRDNIEEKFSETQKFSDLEECLDSLSNAFDTLESANRNIADLVDGTDVAQEIEDACDELENIIFPTMF